MKALVDQSHYVTDYLGNTGYKIVEKAEDDAVFEVHPNLIWVDCANDLNINTHYYINGAITPIPEDPNPSWVPDEIWQ